MTDLSDFFAVADGLRAARDYWRARHRNGADRNVTGFPSREQIKRFITDLAGALFPLRLGTETVHCRNEAAFVVETLAHSLE